MLSIDLNCDLGEGFENDASIMPFISSANIACGFHAGDKETMLRTIGLAAENKVKIGAHPSFLDRKYFGRREMELPPGEVYDLVSEQVLLLTEMVKTFGLCLHHVKPHGALYNMAARDKTLAMEIATAVKDFDPMLIIYGLSGAALIKAAHKINLKSCNEVFGDRNYLEDGSLIPRTDENALLEDTGEVISRVLQMVTSGMVKTLTGREIPLIAETLCIHGDGKFALQFARDIHSALGQSGILICAPS
jgi:5-oxoprolinase (ATP-hydrolysing) subunit A